MAVIEMCNGSSVLVDDADYGWLSRYGWHPLISGGDHSKFYAARCNGRSILMHREITGARRGEFVDHINGDRLDNRRSNLRLCTRSQNLANRGRNKGKSTYKGVYLTPHGRYAVVVIKNQERHHVGTYDDPVDAALAYDMKAIELFGEYARPTFLEATE